MVVIVLAIGMLTLSGLQYIISPAAGGKEEATKRIWAALTGLLIALSAYLILNTINPNLVGASLNLDNIGNITPPRSPIDPNNGGNPEEGGGGNPPSGNHEYPSGVGLTEDEARNQLSQAGVRVNAPPCGGMTYQQYRNTHNGSGCTNLDGLSQESVDQIISLKNDCGCKVVVNGATEAGHSAGGTYGTHAPGGTAIDISRRDNADLDNYIQSGTYLGLSGGRPLYQIGDRRYWKEDSAHWHSY
jgi:hypothetical protein